MVYFYIFYFFVLFLVNYKKLNIKPAIYKIPDTEKAALIGGFLLKENKFKVNN